MTDKDALTPGPLENGNMYSTAFQFYSHINASVDPRTCVYGASVDLASGEGNRLRGPHFAFRLSYSAMDSEDTGFGRGWRLGVTELDLATRMLALSSGDTHRLESLPAGIPAKFPDRKLDSCSLTVVTQETAAMVEHITGVVEYLERVDERVDKLRTTRIVNPSGDALHLKWGSKPVGFCLEDVFDDDNQLLLHIDYSKPEDVVLTLHLGDSPLEMHFHLAYGALSSITLPIIEELNAVHRQASPADGTSAAPDPDEAAWEFTYEPTDSTGLTLLKSVRFPDGIEETVTYLQTALELPDGAPRRYMPAVSERIRKSISSGEQLQRSSYDYYDFFGNNFYGFGAVSSWVERFDQLLHLLNHDDYQYGSTESQYDSKGVVCTIKREYNHFHLITRERTFRGSDPENGVVHDVETFYGIEEGVGFNDLKISFQLPRETRTTLYDIRHPEVKQVTSIICEYDDDDPDYVDPHGNIVSRKDTATGITELSEYYPVDGEPSSCPSDPMGRVRRIKSRTTIPGAKGGDARVTRYAYVAVPVKTQGTRSWARASHYIQASEEATFVKDGDLLVRSTQEFIRDNGDQHGSLAWETREQDGLTETRSFEYVTEKDADGRPMAVTTTTKHKTHDDVETSTAETLHLVSGLVKSSVDALGNRTDYTYDGLGRRVTEMVSADDADYAATTQWIYQLTMSTRWITRVGITNLPHRVHMDEQGRGIQRDEPLPDGNLVPVHTLSYDTFGQLIKETHHDQVPSAHLDPPPDAEVGLDLTTTYLYDDWGRCTRTLHPDGSVSESVTDLVASLLPDEQPWTRTTQWQSDSDGRRMAWECHYTDVSGNKRRSEVGEWSDGFRLAPNIVRTWEYDGMSRCIAMSEEFQMEQEGGPVKKVTRQEWDAFDRLVLTVLPDQTQVKRTYAMGHEEELVARLSVLPPDGESEILLGTRSWDGMGRLKAETAGSLSTTYRYEPGQMSASLKTLPNLKTVHMQYDKRLREVLTGSQWTDGSEDGAGVRVALTEANYHKKLGLPESIKADAGQMQIETDYLGRMTRQVMTLDGDEPRTSHVELTPGGLPLRKLGTDGVWQIVTYDRQGRLSSVEEERATPDASIKLGYDGFSRLSTRTVSSATGEIIQNMEYDAFGRIATYRWTHVSGSERFDRQLDLAWRADDKICRRTWFVDGVEVRKEDMHYDVRGRLDRHVITAEEGELPIDEMGHPYVMQEFTHDCMDNLLEVKTTLHDGNGLNTTTYEYDDRDRDRLIRVTNSMAGYPGYDVPITLDYDENGNLTGDGQGRVLEWDEVGRLSAVTTTDGRRTEYVHGPDSRISIVRRTEGPTYRYREDGALAFEVDAAEQRRFIRVGGAVVAETRLIGSIRDTWLLGTDPQGSVVTEFGGPSSVPDDGSH